MFSIKRNNRHLKKVRKNISTRISTAVVSDIIGEERGVLHKSFSEVFMVESPSEGELVAVALHRSHYLQRSRDY